MSVSGSISAKPYNTIAHELGEVTITRASTLIPQGTFNAQNISYFLSATITNNTSGEWLKITTSTILNTAVTIDCENKIAYTANNSPVGKLEFSSVRSGWLNLLPGSNTLQLDDPGTAGLTFVTNFRDRNS
jgi:phage-related protein